MRSARIRRTLGLAFGTAIVVGMMVAPPELALAAPTCVAPVPSTTQPGYTVADPNCDVGTTNPFVPLTDAAGQPLSQVYAGIRNGAAFRIEVPLNWNGDLVLYAHGFRGNGTLVFVDQPGLRAFHIGQGFAWAASSYQTNGYDVGQGVTDSHDLIAIFADVVGKKAKHVYMTGASMGGHITAVAIEHFRHDFVGAMPYCGVLADTKLFDFFVDVNVTAAALTGAPITFPLEPPADFVQTYTQLVLNELPLLGDTFGKGVAPTLTPLGVQWEGVTEQRSGGTRPGFDSAFKFWASRPSLAPLQALPFHFGIYPGLTGGTVGGIADGNVTSNRFTVYQMDGDIRLSAAELELNRNVLRVSPTASASRDLSGVPLVAGDPRIPVLSLHDIGDLFVPFSMEQIYGIRTFLHGQSGLFASRAIRGVGHCDFNQAELQAGFGDLVTWVRTGHRPAGDDILDRREVADAAFGCRFTVGVHAGFVAPACPSTTN